MFRVHTSAIVAAMQDAKALGNWAAMHKPAGTVRFHILAEIYDVAIVDDRCCFVVPASAGHYLGPRKQSGFQIVEFFAHSCLPDGIGILQIKIWNRRFENS